MSLLLTIILIIVLLNAFGAAIPTYRTGGFYGYSWGAVIVVILVLWLLGIR